MSDDITETRRNSWAWTQTVEAVRRLCDRAGVDPELVDRALRGADELLAASDESIERAIAASALLATPKEPTR